MEDDEPHSPGGSYPAGTGERTLQKCLRPAVEAELPKKIHIRPARILNTQTDARHHVAKRRTFPVELMKQRPPEIVQHRPRPYLRTPAKMSITYFNTCAC